MKPLKKTAKAYTSISSIENRRAKKSKNNRKRKRKFMRYLRIALRGGTVHSMVQDCFLEIQEEVLPEKTVTFSGRESCAPEKFSEMKFLR